MAWIRAQEGCEFSFGLGGFVFADERGDLFETRDVLRKNIEAPASEKQGEQGFKADF
ncbi:MAG TPA: hypothetical protein VM941_06840 [Pyrinomonadaceae bacterium]|nr:hypothetical protein [Pyrinomonadaceae bacterium]